MDALQVYLDSVRNMPFQWGEHDCALFAAKALDAMHGTKYEQAVRNRGIRSALSFRRLLRSGKTLEAMVTSELGAPIGESLKKGDIVLAGTTSGLVLGIAVPPVVLRADVEGTSALPLSSVLRAWRVG